MKSFKTYIQERSMLGSMLLSASLAAGSAPTAAQPTPEPAAAEKSEQPKRKTVSAEQFAASNTERNGRLESGDLVMVGNLKNPTPWNPNAGPKPWYFGKAYLNPQAAQAFKEMDDAYFKETGKRISINSAYRSREQQGVFGKKYGVAAAPGKSRHGLGLAMDVQPGTPEFDWMKTHGKKYGWQWMNIKNDACHFGYCGTVEVPGN